jgi:hypothetical protein
MDFPVLVKIKDGTEREAASPAPTADARTVVRPRSGTCGGECAARPCTLREMRGGQQALDVLPWVRLWAELAVLAHLTGWPMPVPTPAALAALLAHPARLAQCAVSHAIDAAMAVRPGIVRPTALAAHVAAAIRARAERAEWRCLPDEPEWLLGTQPTDDVIFGVVRPSALEAAGTADLLREVFIDCQWPAPYLASGGSVPVGRA